MGYTPTTAGHVAAEVRAEMARQQKRNVDLAELLGLSPQATSGRMTGKTPFTLDEMGAVAEWLGLSPSHFFPGQVVA